MAERHEKLSKWNAEWPAWKFTEIQQAALADLLSDYEALRQQLAASQAELDSAVGMKEQWRSLCHKHEQTILDERCRAEAAEAREAEAYERAAKVAFDAAMYSGCPAEFIAEEIRDAVRAAGKEAALRALGGRDG